MPKDVLGSVTVAKGAPTNAVTKWCPHSIESIRNLPRLPQYRISPLISPLVPQCRRLCLPWEISRRITTTRLEMTNERSQNSPMAFYDHHDVRRQNLPALVVDVIFFFDTVVSKFQITWTSPPPVWTRSSSSARYISFRTSVVKINGFNPTLYYHVPLCCRYDEFFWLRFVVR